MQSASTTVFKQKICPKCRNNHNNDGVLCSFCASEAAANLARRPPMPPNFWVKCLIDRDGDTELNIGNIRYTFRRNQSGDSVCEIINQGHYLQILKSSLYEPYVPDQPAVVLEDGPNTEPDEGDWPLSNPGEFVASTKRK